MAHEVVFRLENIRDSAWVDELYYRMFGSSIGSEEELADAVGEAYLESGDASDLRGDARERLSQILNNHGYTVVAGNVMKDSGR